MSSNSGAELSAHLYDPRNFHSSGAIPNIFKLYMNAQSNPIIHYHLFSIAGLVTSGTNPLDMVVGGSLSNLDDCIALEEQHYVIS